MIAADEMDQIIPTSITRATYNRHKASASVTGLKEFKGRDQLLIGERGCDEVADCIPAWPNTEIG